MKRGKNIRDIHKNRINVKVLLGECIHERKLFNLIIFQCIQNFLFQTIWTL